MLKYDYVFDPQLSLKVMFLPSSELPNQHSGYTTLHLCTDK